MVYKVIKFDWKLSELKLMKVRHFDKMMFRWLDFTDLNSITEQTLNTIQSHSKDFW